MKKKKRPYEKPKVMRISLDAKCAVLGYCKSTTGPGLLQDYCHSPSACSTLGT